MAIEDSDGILNAAGYWTVGVAKGLAFVAVPVFAFSLMAGFALKIVKACLLYTSPSPRDGLLSRMPSSA